MSEIVNGQAPIVIVFGSRLLADRWAQRNAFNPRRVFTATRGAEHLRGVTCRIKVVRFGTDVWKPTTFPDERRVKEVEVELRRIESLYPGRVIEVD